jgi:hypothetical protein
MRKARSMEKCYRVIVLVEEGPETFMARISKVSAKSRGDATIDVLMFYAKEGLNLSSVKKTSVREMPLGKSTLELGEVR